MYQERKENEALREERKHATQKMRRDKNLKLKMKTLIQITRSEYKINKGNFYLRPPCPFSPSQLTKLALNLNAGSPSLAEFNTHRSSYLNRFLNNLADRNIASLLMQTVNQTNIYRRTLAKEKHNTLNKTLTVWYHQNHSLYPLSLIHI